MALLDHGEADGLGEVAFARAGRPQEEAVLVLGDEAAGGELEDEAAVHLGVEVEVEGVEGLAAVAEAGLLDAALEEPVLAAEQLVLDERGEEVDGGELRPSGPGAAAVSRPAAMPEQRSWRRARCSSTRFMSGSPPGSSGR